jgi:hypothetical protein
MRTWQARASVHRTCETSRAKPSESMPTVVRPAVHGLHVSQANTISGPSRFVT